MSQDPNNQKINQEIIESYKFLHDSLGSALQAHESAKYVAVSKDNSQGVVKYIAMPYADKKSAEHFRVPNQIIFKRDKRIESGWSRV